MSDLETERYGRPGGDTFAERAAFLTNEAGDTGDPRERRERLAAGLAAIARAGGQGAGRGAGQSAGRGGRGPRSGSSRQDSGDDLGFQVTKVPGHGPGDPCDP